MCFFGFISGTGCLFCAASHWSHAVLAVAIDTARRLVNIARKMSDSCLLILLQGDRLSYGSHFDRLPLVSEMAF